MSRRIFGLFCLVLFFGSVSGLTWSLSNQQQRLRGWETATDPTSGPLPLRVPLAGVNVALDQYSSNEELRSHLASMEALGITWIRQQFSWAETEPLPGTYEWEFWDNLIGILQDYPGLKLIAVFGTTPPWARIENAVAHPTAPPARDADFSHFVGMIAARYGQYLDYYQIWDEPNLANGWGGRDPDPAAYTVMLQGAYSAIHESDPSAVVLAAGLAPTIETGRQNLSDILYLRAMYEHGARGYFDAAAGKPYGFSTGPEDRRTHADILNFSRLILLREEMVRQNDAAKPLWGVNFGWNSLPENWQGQPSIWGAVTRAQQLEYIQQAYKRAATEWPWSGGLILESWQPNAAQDNPRWGFALVPPQADRTYDIEQLSTVFEPAVQNTALPGRHDTKSPYVSFSGEWEFSELGADIGYEQNSEFLFHFTGTDIAFELKRGNYRGYLFVTVDGVPANHLPLDEAGRSYIILTSADAQPRVDTIPVALNLEPGLHTLHARAEFGWDQWAVVGFRVGAASDGRAFNVSSGLLLGALFLSTLGLIRSARNLRFPQFIHTAWNKIGNTSQILIGWVASVLVAVGMALAWSESIPALLRRDPPGIVAGILTAGVLYFSDSLILIILAGILLGYVVYHRTDIGLFLTVLWAPFFLFPVVLYEYAVPMAEVCLLITVAAWLLKALISHAKRMSEIRLSPADLVARWNTLDWSIFLLVLLASLSLLWAEQTKVALREWRTMILEPAVFYLIVHKTIRTRQQIVHLADALVTAAVLAATVGLVMFFRNEGLVSAEGGTLRLAGVYGSPNNVG
ncbi:MAG: beta-galactosidase, partial [Anaerolineales bacterium]|nr:beta-galactosidase [Anaerolineales bacterium]